MARKKVNGVIDIPPQALLLAVGIAGFLIYKVWDEIFGDSEAEKKKQQVLDNVINKDVDTVLSQQKSNYSNTQINGYADTIDQALNGADLLDDDSAATTALFKMHNEADVYSLIKAFGLRQNYNWVVPVGDKMGLQEFLRYNLQDWKLDAINSAWANDGIKYRL